MNNINYKCILVHGEELDIYSICTWRVQGIIQNLSQFASECYDNEKVCCFLGHKMSA